VVGDSLLFTGEYRSTATLEFQGGQLELLSALAETGRPLVIVLINSKPLVLPPAIHQAAAVIEAFNPGMLGGEAIAALIAGDFNPSGRLPISFPRHVGQQPIYYSQVRGQHGDRYADLTQDPLYPFGYGLSYTRFTYADLRVLTSTPRIGQPVRLSFTVANVGPRDGVEVAQIYLRDEVTSATWVQRELKAFRRLELRAGESRTVEIELPPEAFSIVNAAGDRVVEPGAFTLLVGPSSREPDCLRDTVVLAG
jgi:beta-glucosidase